MLISEDDWSLDVCVNRSLVLGHKTRDDQVLLTLSERMSREFLEHFKNNTASTGTTSSRQSLLIMARSSRI